jgi:hypothetical protein
MSRMWVHERGVGGIRARRRQGCRSRRGGRVRLWEVWGELVLLEVFVMIIVGMVNWRVRRLVRLKGEEYTLELGILFYE